jgi:hypothetical protein
VTVLENPSAQQIVGILHRSKVEMVKGLIVSSDLFFWDATYATHGHVAEQIFPADCKRAYWEHPDYVNNRLIIQMDDGHPTMDFEPDLLKNPRILQLLKTDLIYFHFPGAGFMNYSEMLENEAENERYNQARKLRMQSA